MQFSFTTFRKFNSIEHSSVCRKPENVDVYTGALSEPPLKGSAVGPLLSCILTDQFLRLKRGDSHWYERRKGPQSFTSGIYQSIYDHSN